MLSEDVWSAGLCFAELLRGSPVFMGTSSIDQLYKIFAALRRTSLDIYIIYELFTHKPISCKVYVRFT